jgi:hypothetical protein
MIVIDLPMDKIVRGASGLLFANDGGGGEGGADPVAAGLGRASPSGPTLSAREQQHRTHDDSNGATGPRVPTSEDVPRLVCLALVLVLVLVQ